jgi:hypothetical protein
MWSRLHFSSMFPPNSCTLFGCHPKPIEHHEDSQVLTTGCADKKLRFVQLYTSKSYENRRSDLVNPPDAVNLSETETGMQLSTSTENLSKHVLSPTLVDAISKTTQVVWATTKKQEGLTGRSDIPLQTAVGMPVAVDGSGNMCIVVMFSPNNIQSTDEAMEYLQSISQSATSGSIPCLLPAFDPDLVASTHTPHHLQGIPDQNLLGPGITARFVSLEEAGKTVFDTEVHNHEVTAAPKDTFGIPMLPGFDDLVNGNVTPEESIDVFDEASYGVWTTIMENKDEEILDGMSSDGGMYKSVHSMETNDNHKVQPDPSLQVVLPKKSRMSESRKERLEEFCSAFLGMSVFDLADVWVPAENDGYDDCLRHVMSVSSIDSNERLNEFKVMSEHVLMKYWTGAVGRAYSSGNPVWSANPNVFIDPGRSVFFDRAGICTALAVPVYSSRQILPECVVCCYSMVRSGSVPFVLRFVQQALRLLWEGLDNVEPHKSVSDNVWRDVAPADLGEMAADVEMQQHFLTKKRPHNLIHTDENRQQSNDCPQASSLANQLQSIQLPNGETIMVPLQLPDDYEESPQPLSPLPAAETMQNHFAQALRHVGEAVRFDDCASTNAEGTKRAHVMKPVIPTGSIGMPLRKPGAFPTQVLSSSSMPSNTAVAKYPNQYPQTLEIDITAESIAQQWAANDMNTQQQPNEYLAPAETNNQYCQPADGMAHELDHDSESGSSKCCRIQGCDDPVVPRRPYCEKHSGPRQCEHVTCSKCAQGSTRCKFESWLKVTRWQLFRITHPFLSQCYSLHCSRRGS